MNCLRNSFTKIFKKKKKRGGGGGGEDPSGLSY